MYCYESDVKKAIQRSGEYFVKYVELKMPEPIEETNEFETFINKQIKNMKSAKIKQSENKLENYVFESLKYNLIQSKLRLINKTKSSKSLNILKQNINTLDAIYLEKRLAFSKLFKSFSMENKLIQKVLVNELKIISPIETFILDFFTKTFTLDRIITESCIFGKKHFDSAGYNVKGILHPTFFEDNSFLDENDEFTIEFLLEGFINLYEKFPKKITAFNLAEQYSTLFGNNIAIYFVKVLFLLLENKRFIDL